MSRVVSCGPVDRVAARVRVVQMLLPEDEQLRHQPFVRMQAAALTTVVADHLVGPLPLVRCRREADARDPGTPPLLGQAGAKSRCERRYHRGDVLACSSAGLSDGCKS